MTAKYIFQLAKASLGFPTRIQSPELEEKQTKKPTNVKARTLVMSRASRPASPSPNTTQIESSRNSRRRRRRRRRGTIEEAMTQDEDSHQAVDITDLRKGKRIDKWIILEFIAEGAFGCVYKVGHHGDHYAIKFNIGNVDDAKLLSIERHVLKMAKRAESKHICKLIDSGKIFEYEYIVMTLVGKTLKDLVKQRKGKKFSAGCVISIGRQCVEAIEEVHRIGFIHRDIKPSNFATGRNEHVHGVRKIYLIDFGLSYQYVDSKDQVKHVKHDMCFKGTLRYAPLASHRRRPPGRRDDLESWLYQQIEFTKGSLPWKHQREELDIMEAKDKARTKEGMRKLLQFCPADYGNIMQHIIKLRQSDRPDYDFIYKMLRKILFEAKLQEYPYDWEPEALRPFHR